MINYQYFPKSQELTAHLKSVIKCFKAVDGSGRARVKMSSNEMLAQLKPHLEGCGFRVESGKKLGERIDVPVLFGENGSIDKAFFADALSSDKKTVIEVEAGRAVFNNQFLKDIFQACLMTEVEYLVIAVLNEYHFHSAGKKCVHKDYFEVKTFLETLYASNRLCLPLKGILVIGY